MTKTPEPTTAKKRLTRKEWAEAESLYATGSMTQVGIAKKFGIHEDTVYAHMRAKSIKKGEKADEMARRVAEKVAEAAIGDAAVTAARIRETKENHFKMATGISKLTWNEVLTAKQNGTPFGAILANLKSLDAAITVLAKARNECYVVLGLDKEDTSDGDVPELHISELTADEIEELRNRDLNEFEDLPEDTPSSGPKVSDDEADDGVVEES